MHYGIMKNDIKTETTGIKYNGDVTIVANCITVIACLGGLL